MVGNAFDPLYQRIVLLLELDIEPLRHLLHVERTTHAGQHLRRVERVLLAHRERGVTEALQQGVIARSENVGVIHEPEPHSRGALLGPEPPLLAGRTKHQQHAARVPTHRSHDPMLIGPRRQLLAGGRPQQHATLVGHRPRRHRSVSHFDLSEPGRRIVPTQPPEQLGELGPVEQPPHLVVAQLRHDSLLHRHHRTPTRRTDRTRYATSPTRQIPWPK